MLERLKNIIHRPTYCTMKSARPIEHGKRVIVEQRIAELRPWFHNFQIAADLWTNPDGSGPGPQYPHERWEGIEPLLPDVTGKTVLDIGCSSGFFSLKMKELGASYVLESMPVNNKRPSHRHNSLRR